MNKLSAFMLLCIGYAGCNSPEEKNKHIENELQRKIFAIHDRVMPQMDKMVTLEGQLKKLNIPGKGVNNRPPFSDTAARGKRIEAAFLALDSSDRAMMNWMNAFTVDWHGKSHDETMHYLHTEYDKVKRIDSMVSVSMKKAKALVDEK